ncbi:MAG TPA: S9 family peptidase [Pyrinomonadaceae bacterium]|nr:S9 family peptidase [Pyrinomonadaceae bacterium]
MKRHLRLAAGLACLLLFAAQASAELPALIPRDVLFGNPEKAGPQISPDGKMIAYLAPEGGVLNVWVRTLGQTDDRVVTSDKKRGVRIYFWQQDSRHILYLQDEGGNENWHVYQTDLATKETRDLTPFEKVQARIIAVDPKFPDAILVAINNRDPKVHDINRIDLKTGKTEMIVENKDGMESFAADNNLRVRAAKNVLPDGGTEVFVRDDEQSAWRSFQKWGPDEVSGSIAGFSPDGKKLWLISSVDANTGRLVEADISTGKQTVVAEDKQYDVSGAMSHPTRRHLEAVRLVRARSEWVVIDKAIKADFDALRKVRDGDFSVTSRDDADKTWLVAYAMDNGPIYYYTYDRPSKKAALLFSNRPALEKYTLARMRPVSFQARDGMTIHGYLTLPVGVPEKNLPMVLNVHGGPWGRDTWGLDPEVQWLANRGYAVFQVNFRGSTGYGKAHLNAGNRQWGAKMHDDLLDAKNWAIKQGYADPKRVAIYGGSYGGYATLVGLAFTPEEFAAGVDIVGPSNLNTLLKSIPPHWGPIKARFTKRMGDTEEFLNSRSPLFKAGQITRPLLVAQGANDPRVNIKESDQIVEAMRKANKPVEYVVFADEGHGFARPANRLFFYARAEEFLAKYLGGRSEPAGEIKGHSGEIK